jgi:hypothetical protein
LGKEHRPISYYTDLYNYYYTEIQRKIWRLGNDAVQPYPTS